MNTATRVMEPSAVSKPATLARNINWNLGVIIVTLGILLSAFGLIYLKDLNRQLFIQYQNQQKIQTQYEVEWGKLLLEQSTWSTQARVESTAQQKLNMTIAKSQDIILLKA
jgi:cell division protein FtsL